MGSMPPSTPPITTPPLRTMPPAPPVQSSSPFRVVFLLAVVVVLVGIVVWFWSFQSAPQPQQTTATFLLHTADGTSWWYQLSGSTIRPLAPQTATSTGGEVTIVESSQGLPVGTPVLATHAQLPGERFGLLSQNGRFTSLTLPGTERRGLTVRPDGLAAFAYLTDSQSASALSAWHVGVLDTSRAGISVFTDLGMGYAPSFATNGNILALAP
ncbi:MAG: hypothetical protein Q7R74_01100, partial [bacterium]|nr:hypothetical protein [bacterium]